MHIAMTFEAFVKRIRGLFRLVYWRAKRLPQVKLPLRVVRGDYPLNMVYMSNDGKERKTRTIVVECSPGKRMICVNYGPPLCLHLPYTYFIVRYAESISPLGKYLVYMGMNIAFSNQRLKDSNEKICSLPFCNQTGPFSYCLGSAEPKIGPYLNVRELFESCANAFWSSAFQQNTSRDTVLGNWAAATKLGRGEEYVRKIIQYNSETPIHHLIGDKSENERFFEYKSEPKPTKRKSGNRPHRRKRQKSSGR